MYGLGTVAREDYEASQRTGRPLPGLHSPLFAPAPELTLKTGITATALAALELLERR
jgi:hippurate hydrolase